MDDDHKNKKNIRTTGVFLGFILVWMFAHPALAQNNRGERYPALRVEKIRIGPHPEYTRILIDLNRAAEYKVTADFSKKKITVTLANARLGPQVRSRSLGDRNIARIDAKRIAGQVKIELTIKKSNTRFFHFLNRDPAQIVLDFKGEDKPILQARIGKAAAAAVPKEADLAKTEAKPKRPQKKSRVKGMTSRLLEKVLREDIENKIRDGWVDYQEALKTYQDRNYPKAVELFQDYLQNHPSSQFTDHILYLIADSMFQIAFREPNPIYEDALTAYKHALRSYPDSLFADHAEYKIGFLYGEMGYLLEAKILFEDALKTKPANQYNAARRIALATMMINENRYPEAYEAFQRILKDTPKDPEARSAIFEIAKYYYDQENFDRALQIYEEGASRWPSELNENPGINFNMGDIYYRLRTYGQARKHFFNLINLDPDHPLAHKALNWIGDSYILEGKPLNALYVFDESSKRDSDAREVQYSKVRMADIGVSHPKLQVLDAVFDLSAYYRPFETYEEISQNAQDMDILAEVTLSRGIALLKEQNYIKSIEEFKKLLPLGGQSAFHQKARKFIKQSLVLLVDQFAQQGGVLPILYSFSDYTSLSLGKLNNSKTLLQVGESYQAIGMYPEALRFYDRVKQLDPQGVFQERIFLDLGKIHLVRRNYSEAELVARSYLKNYPGGAQLSTAMELLAKAYSGSKQYKKALNVYQQLLSKSRENVSEIHYRIGETYTKLNNLQAAALYYQRAISTFSRKTGIVPDYVRKAHYKLGMTLFNSKKYSRAIPALKSARELFPEDTLKDWGDFMLIESYDKLKNKTQMVSELKTLAASESTDDLLKKAAEAKLKVLNWEKEFKDKL